MSMKGMIFDIQRFCISDGPGIRTTVFLKGCPLNCVWCHNPESKLATPQLAVYDHKCIGCARCAGACGSGALTNGPARVDRSRCKACGECARACPAEALKVIGREAWVEEIEAAVMQDAAFYAGSGGGVTLSGGEPLLQPEFSFAILQAIKDKGINTAVETCGFAPWEDLSRIAEVTDLFLYDLKIIDPLKHEEYCGADNAVILSNLGLLADSGSCIVIRVPVVPEYTDAPENIRRISEFAASLAGAPNIELMPYHNAWRSKYAALGMICPC